MKTGRIFFYFLLSFSCFSFSAQTPNNCDSLKFKISGSQAVKKAMDRNYRRHSLVELRLLKAHDSCLWYVMLRETLGSRHHGYYSDTFRNYYIDPYSGSIVKESGYKKLGGKIPGYDKDYREKKK